MLPNQKLIALSLTVLGGSAFLGTGTFASTPDAIVQDPDKPKQKRLAIDAETHELREFIDRCSRFLGHNYLVQETDFQGSSAHFTFQNPITVDPEGCEQLLSQVLYTRGFAIVPVDPGKKIYEVINMQGPKRAMISAHATPMTAEEVLANRHKRLMVMCTVELDHVNSQTAVNQMRPFFSQAGAQAGVTIGAIGNGRVMILQGYTDQVAGVLDLLSRADVPNEAFTEPLRSLQMRVKQLEKRVAELEK